MSEYQLYSGLINKTSEVRVEGLTATRDRAQQVLVVLVDGDDQQDWQGDEKCCTGEHPGGDGHREGGGGGGGEGQSVQGAPTVAPGGSP